MRGRAVVVDGATTRPGAPRPSFSCLGPAADLDPLMADLAAAGEVPLRLSVEAPSHAAVPAAWRHADHWTWQWLVAHGVPEPDRQGGPAPHELDEHDSADRAAIEAVIDDANPGSFVRPGMPGVEAWLGVRAGEALAGVGALLRMHDGSGHLRGVSVRPAYRGRGLARALSAALTDRGLAVGPGVVTLGVYADNAAALAVYARLGYTVRHTFVAGPTEAGVAAGWTG